MDRNVWPDYNGVETDPEKFTGTPVPSARECLPSLLWNVWMTVRRNCLLLLLFSLEGSV